MKGAAADQGAFCDALWVPMAFNWLMGSQQGQISTMKGWQTSGVAVRTSSAKWVAFPKLWFQRGCLTVPTSLIH